MSPHLKGCHVVIGARQRRGGKTPRPARGRVLFRRLHMDGRYKTALPASSQFVL